MQLIKNKNALIISLLTICLAITVIYGIYYHNNRHAVIAALNDKISSSQTNVDIEDTSMSQTDTNIEDQNINQTSINNKATSNVSNYENNKVEVFDASFAQVTFADIVNAGDVIIKAKILNISDYTWNTVDKVKPKQVDIYHNLYRDYDIQVEDVFKGEISAGDKMTIRSYGGIKDNCNMYSRMVPQVALGDNVILVLSKNRSNFNLEKSNLYMSAFEYFGFFVLKENMIVNPAAEYLKYDINTFYERLNYYIKNPEVDTTKLADPKEHSILKNN